MAWREEGGMKGTLRKRLLAGAVKGQKTWGAEEHGEGDEPYSSLVSYSKDSKETTRYLLVYLEREA